MPFLTTILLSFLSFLSLSTNHAFAQLTDATCSADLAFMNNNLAQNPCIVLSTMFGACTNTVGTFNLQALAPEFSGYAGPTSTDSSQFLYNQCLCSMPIYNLISACESCQSKTVLSFTAFTQSCNSSFTGAEGFPSLKLPVAVPSITALAPWTFIDNTDGTWSQAEVKSALGIVDTDSSSSSVASFSATRVTSAPQSTGSGTGSGRDGGGGSNSTGAIVGGVIGGLALISLVGAGVWYINKLYPQRTTSSILPQTRPEGRGQGQGQNPMAQVPGRMITPASSYVPSSSGHGGYAFNNGFGVGGVGGGGGRSVGHVPMPSLSYSVNMAPNEREAVRWSGDDAKERQVERFGSFASLPSLQNYGASQTYNGLAEVQDEGRGRF
ncbi:hypothetical protein BT69DRAFT_1357513 [Atractiella rhizophila]|nr:hypothetical protein BT69DRAFT_1357513 [Atractiella rhizophila]